MVADLRLLAEARLREAELLLAGGEASGAYYIAGYAVECGLKAVIARTFAAYQLPPKQLIVDSYTHDVSVLVRVAGLNDSLVQEMSIDADFASKWNVVKDWSEASRYEEWSATQATAMVHSVGDPTSGVLRWIRPFW